MKGKRTFKRFLAVVMAVVFTVTGITFTPSEKIEASTSKISVTNVPSGAWGGKKSKYRLGTTSDTSADGKWYLEVSQNEWGNWAGSYQNADGIDGFTFYNEVFNNAGGIFLWSSDLKTEKGLSAGHTYNMSVTINYTGVLKAQNNYVLTEGGSSNLNVSRTVSAGTSSETYTGTVVPTANNDLVLRVSYASSSYQTAEVGTFEVASVSFTEVTTTTPPITSNAQGYYNARTDADWHTIPTNGFQYFFNAAMTGSLYKGGTAINDPLHIRVGNYAKDEGALQTKTPVVSVTAGRTYKLTYNVANTGSLNQGTNTIFAAVTNASNDQDIVNSYSSKVGVNAGDDVDIELTYTAPASGQVYFRLVVGWANLTEFVLTPTNEDITVDWIPTVSENTNIGSNGIKLYNKWTGNTEYFDGSLTSLQDARLKHVAVQQTNPEYYYGEAIRIPNNVAYANCTAGHKYRMTYTFDASQAGGKAILYQNGYNQGEEVTIASGTNTISIDFISNANNNTNAYNTEFQFANATQGMEIDNMDYSFVEMPQTPNNIYGDVIGGNSLKVTWEPPADISGENYDVSLYSGSSATGTPVATATVTHANISAGHTFTGLTPGGTYTAKVESKLNGFTAEAKTGTYTIDPWVPTTRDAQGSDVGTHAIGSDGTILYNAYFGNNSYYTGTDTSLANVRVKQNAAAVATYEQEAIRIPNTVIYNSCTPEHKYRLTVSYDASAAGGTLRLHQQGYSQSSDDAVTAGTNTVSIDFVDESAKKTSSIYTELQIAGVAKDTIIDNISYSFTEMPREVNAVYGTVVGGNSLQVDWQPLAGGLPQSYIVNLYSGSSATGTPVDTATVSAADAAAGHLFTGLTPEATYTAEVIGTLNGFNSTAKTGTYTIDPWIPTATTSTAIGSNGIDIYNRWEGNTHYYTGTLTSLQNVKVKQTANPQTSSDLYYAEAIRIPNSVAYGSCVDEHLYKMTVTFDSDTAGGTVVLSNGFGNIDSHALVSGSNTYEVEFVSDSANNTSAKKTELQFAGAPKDTILDNFHYQVTELPRPATAVYGTVVGGNSLKVTWSPAAAGLSQNYIVNLYSGSSATGTPVATTTVTPAGVAAGYTFTGLTPEGTYTAEVIGVLGNLQSTAVTGTYTIDPWVPTAQDNPGTQDYTSTTAIGSAGIDLYNAYYGKNKYYTGTTSSLGALRVKRNDVVHSETDWYFEAIRIPNNVAYASCTAYHKYRMTLTFNASAAGGTLRLYQNGYNQGADRVVTQGSNSVSIDFISSAANNTSAYNTQIQFAGVANGTELSNFNYTFTEMPQPVKNIWGTSSGGNSLVATWEPATDASETYQVTLLNEAGTSVVAGPYAATLPSGYTFTGLTAEGKYKIKVENTMNGFTTEKVKGPFTVDPWIPTSAKSTAIGGSSSGIDLFNEWEGNTHYYVGTLSSLSALTVKQTANAQTSSDLYYAEAVRIRNDIAYGSCVDEHLYKMTVTFDSDTAGGTVVLSNGFGNIDSHALVSGQNTYEVEFVSDSANNTSAKKTELQFAGAPKDTILDNFHYQVTELPRPVNAVYGTVVGGNSLKVTWAPAAAGLSQNYTVNLYSGSSATGTPVATATVTSAQVAAGYTFTGLTPEATYTAEVIGVLGNLQSTAVTGTYTIDPWIPTSSANTPVGNDGTYIYNEWPSNTQYYVGTLSSLSGLKVKQSTDPQVPQFYYGQAIRIPNSVAYASCVNNHKYRVTASFNASAAGGTAVVWADGYGQGETKTVVSGTNTFTAYIIADSALNINSNFLQIQYGGVAKDTELNNFTYSVVEVPREVSGVGIGSSIGLTNAGGKYVSTAWDDKAKAAGTTYVVSLLDSNDQILYTKTVAGTESSFKFQDGQTDDNGATITINPNTTYTTQVVTKIGTATSDPVPSDQSTNTGVWMRMGSTGSSEAEDVLNVSGNARVSSVWGNLYYRYDHTSSLSDLILKKTSPAESSPTLYYFHKVGQKNSTVFSGVENGARCRLTVSFTANETASGTMTLQQILGAEPTYTNHTVTAGANTFSVECDYNSAYANEYTDLLLGGLGADTEISGITLSVEVLEHWTAGTPGGWVDVGDYAYHIPTDQAGYYSTDTSNRFSFKVNWLSWTEDIGRWKDFYVGTNEKTVYPGSVYEYSINFNRTVPVTNTAGDPPQNKVYLHVLYDNGTDLEIGNATCDASGNASYSGEITIPDDATTARLYWVCQWPSNNERLSIDPNSGDKYTFNEVWRAVDREQAVRDGKYKFIDKDGGAMQYKPSQTSGTGSCDVRIQNGFTDAWVPYLKTNFAEGDYGVNFVEGNEYVATITFDSNMAITTDGFKGIRFSDYNAGQPNSIALKDNEFEITFVYKDGYDITAGLGWLGASNLVLSNFNVSIRDGAPTMPLTNNGTDVVANWAGMPEAAGATKLVYVSYGELKIVDVTGQTSYTFPSEFYPDNDTEVELYDSYTSTEVHGEKLLRATALADMTILDARVDGIAHANTNNIIKLTIKNIGTGMITCADDYRQQFIYIVARQGDWKNYKYLCPDPHDGKTPHDPIFMKPNQVFDDSTTDARILPNIDAWRVEEEGTYTINCSINETKIIREKDYTNNNFTFTKDVSTQLADDTAVLGFQLNSNKSSGGPSEFNPSYRTVCRANKQVVVKEGDTAWTDEGTSETVPTGTYNVKKYGFVYALRDQAGLNSKNEDELMSFNGAKQNKYIKTYEAQQNVDINEWTTKEGSTYNKDNSYFFALTMKDLYYTTDQYETTYTFRSYLQFEAGGKTYTVYPKDVYSTSMYDIAEDLYRYKKMPSEAAHNFLYDNILNIVAMKHNYGKINWAMKDALYWGGEDTAENREIVDNLTKDMYYNALCSDPTYLSDHDEEHAAMIYKYSDLDGNAKAGLPGIDYGEDNYKYTHDHKFRSIRLDESGKYDGFLATLNKDGVRYYSDESYASVYDWIYGEVDHDNGFYKKVEYSWDSNLDKDFGTE